MNWTMRRMLILLWAAMACSCITPHGVGMDDVDPLGWGPDEPGQVVFENADTLCPYQIHVVVRYDRSLAEDTLCLDVQTFSPDSLTLTEQVCLPVPQPLSTSADLLEARTLYRSQVRLRHKGPYVFKIAPAAPVKGVTAVGMDIFDASKSR